MVSTSPDNLWSPNLTDPAILITDLGAMQTSVQAALTKRANFYTGTSAQRTAFTNTAPEGVAWKDTNGTKNLYVKEGAAWSQIWPVQDTGWVTPVLAQNTNPVPPHGFPIGVRKIGNRVDMRGRISRLNGADYPAGDWGTSTTPLTLQAQFRPSSPVSFSTCAAGFASPNLCRMEISTNGTLRFGLAGASSWLDFDGMYWYID